MTTKDGLPEHYTLFPTLERISHIAHVVGDFILHRHSELFEDNRPNTGASVALDRALFDLPQPYQPTLWE